MVRSMCLEVFAGAERGRGLTTSYHLPTGEMERILAGRIEPAVPEAPGNPSSPLSG